MTSAAPRRILAIVNPVSGQHDPDKTRKRIEEAAHARGAEVTIKLTEGDGDALRWAQAAADEGYDLILAAGGDGTIMEALSGQIKGGGKVPLAQLPTGTANLLARALGIATDPAKALEVAFGGKTVHLDVGYLPELDRYFALVAGAGFDARLIEDAPRGLKNVLGFFSYLLSGIKNLFNLRHTTITIEIDGKRETRRAHTVMIVNIGSIDHLKLSLGPEIGPHDGMLDAVIVTPTGLWDMARLFVRLLLRRFENYRDLDYIRAKTISISSSPPLPVQIDGEPVGETPIHAEVVPNGALVVVPETYESALSPQTASEAA